MLIGEGRGLRQSKTSAAALRKQKVNPRGRQLSVKMISQLKKYVAALVTQ